MLGLIFALQFQPPAAITEVDFAALQQCLASHPPALGDNRCLEIDDGVAAIETCLDAAPDGAGQRDVCVERYGLECSDALHSAGVSTNLLLRYCVTGNIALLQALNAEQWAHVEARLDPDVYGRLRLIFKTVLAELRAPGRADSYELSWLSRVQAFYILWVYVLDSMLREPTLVERA